MKKIILSVLTLMICIVSFGQTADYKKLPSFGIHFILNDFQTAADIRTRGLASVIEEKQFSKIKRMSAGLAVSYTKGLSNHIDFSGILSGSSTKFSEEEVREKWLFEGAATANFKLLTDRYILNPFFTAGIGGFKYGSTFGAFTPVGIGLQIKAARDIFAVVNSQYRMPVTDAGEYHFYHSIGIVASLKNRPAPVVVAPPVAVVLDRDGDGILDADDKCPDVPGLASLQGCPDRDSDGISDADDKCPDVAGLAKYEGCPIPDTDGDGVNDEEDKCPTVAGFSRYQGCPIPDTDGDGVNDEEDRCPNRPGPATNMGCPVIAKEVIEKISLAAKNVFFATGSYKLLPKSFKSLDEVANLMKADESLFVDIDGHTDAVGSSESNQVLSDNRAGAVKEYLIKQGVDASRLKSTGFGEDKPVADNTTAAGRAKNRRTEMTVRNF